MIVLTLYLFCVVIYEIKHRDERFEQTSRVQNEKGLGFIEASIRGKAIHDTDEKRIRKIYKQIPRKKTVSTSSLSHQTSIAKYDGRSVGRSDLNDQLAMLTDLPVEVRQNISKQKKTRLPQRKLGSSMRTSKQDENLSKQIHKRIIDQHNVKIGEAIQNRATDEEDHVPLVDPRIVSQFESTKQGKAAKYSELMKSFQTGDLRFKYKPMANKKRFGVMMPDAAAHGHQTFNAERESSRVRNVPQDYTKKKSAKVCSSVASDTASSGG